MKLVEWVRARGPDLGPMLTRLGMAITFLLFGIFQLLRPQDFTGYLPEFLFESPYATQIVLANGGFEVVAGILLLLGFFVRPVAFLLGLHLFMITIELWRGFGFNDIIIRDIGLTIATFAVFFFGNDKWCLSQKFGKPRVEKSS